MANIVAAYGNSGEIAVASGSKIAVTSNEPVRVYQVVGYPQVPSTMDLLYTTAAGENYVSSAFSAAATIVIEASGAPAQYEVGTTLTFNTGPVPLRFVTQGAPETAADTATLTVAQMLCGILVATPTAAAAYTTPTGAVLDDAMPVGIGTNVAFDLTIINIGGTGDDITLTAGASGFSIVGDAVVRPSADSGTEQAGQGTFRIRRTAADTFIAYRIS